MRIETNDALSKLSFELAKEPIDLLKVSTDLTELICIVSEVESDLSDCVNELCLKCGSYHESYLGACNGCRWKAVKEAMRCG